MAVVGHLHKIVFGGRLAETESWSCSLHLLNPDPGVIVIGGLLSSGIDLWHKRPTSKITSLSYLDYIKVNELNPLSVPSTVPLKPASKPFTRYLDEANVNQLNIVTPATGSTSPGPVQISYAASTLTGFLRGPAHSGRFYPPVGLIAPGGDGRATALAAKDMATSAAQLITDINGACPGSCVVFSGIGLVTRQIMAIRVGRVADTQRRRRRNLVESYETTNVS